MNITVSQLPEDYVTPAGMKFGSYWAMFVDGELSVAEKDKDDIDDLVKAIEAQA